MWLIDHGTDELFAGEQYHVSYYEDSTNEVPVYQQKVGTSSTNGLSGIFMAGLGAKGHFQDKQGAALIEMLVGTLSIKSMTVTTEIDGSYYSAAMDSFTVVPEPSTLSLLGIAFVALPLCRRLFV